jgi:hypothetical protein
MSLYKQYKTDSSRENLGARIVKGSNDDGTEIVFMVSRAGKSNTTYKLASERAFKPHRQAIKAGTLSNEVAENLLLDLFCGHILKGWENVRNEQGADLPFSTENAKKLMTDLPDLYQELSDAANETANFLDSNREADAKN